jgi:hypothetical protein
MDNGKAPIDERLQALAESMELLAASSHDLRASVEALAASEHETAEAARANRERDAKYLSLIADVMKQWAEGK